MSDAPSLTPEHSSCFRVMADKIDHNRGNGFAGAFVIVPPNGEPEDMLLLDNAKNPAIFWAMLQTRANIALADLDAAARGAPGGFGRR